MPKNAPPEYEMTFEIRSFDVDASCTANLTVFCKYMQEAAYHHAELFGVGYSQLSLFNMSWVLSRMRLEVERLPQWGETVTLRTWPSGKDRLFYYRDFEITDADRKCLLRASTAWFVIDYVKRERALPDWWADSDLPVGPKVFSSKLGRLKGGGGDVCGPMSVNYGDLDLNGHVNNIRYVEWILNSLPLEFHQEHEIKSMEVNYLAEALYGHALSISNQQNGLVMEHGIGAGGLDLFRARSTWKSV